MFHRIQLPEINVSKVAAGLYFVLGLVIRPFEIIVRKIAAGLYFVLGFDTRSRITFFTLPYPMTQIG